MVLKGRKTSNHSPLEPKRRHAIRNTLLGLRDRTKYRHSKKSKGFTLSRRHGLEVPIYLQRTQFRLPLAR